jgi:hypothetical protein
MHQGQQAHTSFKHFSKLFSSICFFIVFFELALARAFSGVLGSVEEISCFFPLSNRYLFDLMSMLLVMILS